MAEYEFSFEPSNKERWLMLGEQDQPEGPYTIEKTEPKNNFVVLHLKNRKGEKFLSAVFPRDVQDCIAEWGVKPSSWLWISLVKKPGSSRYKWIPTNPTLVEEKI